MHSEHSIKLCNVLNKFCRSFMEFPVVFHPANSNYHRNNNVHPKFKCPNCIYMTNISSNYKKHILIHKGERSHGCSFCGKAFIRQDHLKRHVTTCHFKPA